LPALDEFQTVKFPSRVHPLSVPKLRIVKMQREIFKEEIVTIYLFLSVRTLNSTKEHKMFILVFFSFYCVEAMPIRIDEPRLPWSVVPCK